MCSSALQGAQLHCQEDIVCLLVSWQCSTQECDKTYINYFQNFNNLKVPALAAQNTD
jgi:hypothetical protein